MPFLKIVEPPHICDLLLEFVGIAPGTIWECEICKRQWMLSKDNYGNTYWVELSSDHPQYIQHNSDEYKTAQAAYESRMMLRGK